MALRKIDFGLLTDVQLIELLREGSAEAVGRGGAMERAAREAVELDVVRRKQTEEELTRIPRLLARMVVETVGSGWKLTVGGRDLQVSIMKYRRSGRPSSGNPRCTPSGLGGLGSSLTATPSRT